MAHFGRPIWGVSQEEIRKKGDGEQASFQLSSLPLICLGGWTPPNPTSVRYPMDTKVGKSLFWTSHLILYMHNWDLPNSIREILPRSHYSPLDTVREFWNLQSLGIKKNLQRQCCWNNLSTTEVETKTDPEPQQETTCSRLCPGKALWHEWRFVLPGFQQRRLTAKATQQEKSWCPNPGPWIPKPRLWIMSFASWTQKGSPSVCPMHWPSLWATWIHIHTKKEPSTLTDPWDTTNGFLCQCLGSCYKLKEQNMQIQLLYLCGNES